MSCRSGWHGWSRRHSFCDCDYASTQQRSRLPQHPPPCGGGDDGGHACEGYHHYCNPHGPDGNLFERWNLRGLADAERDGHCARGVDGGYSSHTGPLLPRSGHNLYEFSIGPFFGTVGGAPLAGFPWIGSMGSFYLDVGTYDHRNHDAFHGDVLPFRVRHSLALT